MGLADDNAADTRALAECICAKHPAVTSALHPDCPQHGARAEKHRVDRAPTLSRAAPDLPID